MADVIDYNIIGDDMQLVEIELDPGEGVRAEAGAMMYMEDGMVMETIFGDGNQQDQGLLGKLGSAALQMIIYLSAISPCLAFTYMLRGIDLPTILLTLGYCVMGSMGLSIAAILLGTLAAAAAGLLFNLMQYAGGIVIGYFAIKAVELITKRRG